MEYDFFISLQERKETAHLWGCAQHFHRARNLERGKTLPLAMTGCRHEGRRGAFVLLGSRRWVDQSWTHHHHRPNAPSIPQSLLTSNQGLNPGNYTLWESEWQFFQRARSAIAIFQGWKRDRVFSRSTDRLSRIPTVLVGRCRSFVWPGPQYGVTQCKYFDRS